MNYSTNCKKYTKIVWIHLVIFWKCSLYELCPSSCIENRNKKRYVLQIRLVPILKRKNKRKPSQLGLICKTILSHYLFIHINHNKILSRILRHLRRDNLENVSCHSQKGKEVWTASSIERVH
jgi:hypothetical protein